MKGFVLMIIWILVWAYICFHLTGCTVTFNPDGSRIYGLDYVTVYELMERSSK